MFQNFTINAAKISNGHFWTNLIKFGIVLIYKGLNEKNLKRVTNFEKNCESKSVVEFFADENDFCSEKLIDITGVGIFGIETSM